MHAHKRAQLEHDHSGGQDVRRHVGCGNTILSEDVGQQMVAEVTKYLIHLPWIVAFFSIYLISNILGISEVFVIDCNALDNVIFPTAEEWRYILKKNERQIEDGSQDVTFLDRCFIGGWRRCYENFAYDYELWNYQQVKKEKYWLLGGNMVDTDRVAGQQGWKAASETIEKYLAKQNEQFPRKKMFRLNPKIYLSILPLTLLIITFLQIIKYMRSRILMRRIRRPTKHTTSPHKN